MGLLNHAKSLFFTAFLLDSAVFPLPNPPGAVSPVPPPLRQRTTAVEATVPKPISGDLNGISTGISLVF